MDFLWFRYDCVLLVFIVNIVQSGHNIQLVELGKTSDADEGLTGQVGTSLYISPELGKPTRTRYTQVR